MSLDYNNLEGFVNGVRVLLVSVVDNRICLDVGVPGCDVWFFVSFHLGLSVDVCCLTQDCVSFYPFEWINWVEGSNSIYLGFRFIGGVVGGDGGSEVWGLVSDRVREKLSLDIGRGNWYEFGL